MKYILKIWLIIFCLTGFLYTQEATDANQIQLISPSANTNLVVSRREGISWIARDTVRIDIQYSNDEKEWKNILLNIRADIEYIGWKIPKNLNNKKVKIRIIDSKNKTLLDKTESWINIHSPDVSNYLSKVSESESTIKILPLGNSITLDNRSGDQREVKNKIGYRFPLYQLLNVAGVDFSFIGSEYAGSNFFAPDTSNAANAGFPGITTAQLLSLLQTGILNMPQYSVIDTITDGPYLETYIPDIILLHIGTNGTNNPNGTNPDYVEDILDEIDRVELLLGKSIKVLVSRIINRAPNIPEVRLYNDNVKNMILGRTDNPFPDNISMVDMESGAGIIYSISKDPNGSPGNMNDALHPNDKGYTKMAGKWFTSIISYLGSFPNNMISYWSFEEEASSIYNDRVGTNAGNCISCPSSVNGMNDNSILFNGSNSITVHNNSSFNNNLSGDFSIECWVQTTQTGTGNKVFIGTYNVGSTWWLGFNSEDGFAKFSVRSTSADSKLVSSTSKVNDGNWHHIVGVKDYYNENIKIYVDGIMENQTNTNFTNVAFGESNITIGNYTNNYFFDGILDEVAIYEKSLLQTEILNDYNRGLRAIDYILENESLISATVYLSGNYFDGEMLSTLNDLNSIPLKHPFRVGTYNFNGAESVTSIPNADPMKKIVDWVLVSLRSEIDKSSEVARRAGFILIDGTIVDLDGQNPLTFTVNPGNYYLVIEHRNHLSIMSSQKLFITP